MAFASGGSGGVRSDINITPLVDVVLVLLIIFMVMTPTLLKEVDRTNFMVDRAPGSNPMEW